MVPLRHGEFGEQRKDRIDLIDCRFPLRCQRLGNLSVSFRSIFPSFAASKVRLNRLTRAGDLNRVGFGAQETRASYAPANMFG
jgi:hypothetical protein